MKMADTADDADVDEDKPKAKSKDKKKSRLKNPLKMYLEYRAKKRIERERVLMLREERMNEDLERYLMELEEKRCWIALQLNRMNEIRINRKETIARLARREHEKEMKEQEERMRENGLSYFQGNVQSFKRWQNSPAKHMDFSGHKGAVTSCRLSPCLKYMVSCGEDKAIKVWNMSNGECIRTFVGHKKIVNDLDFQKSFQMFKKEVSMVSCSGDGTLKLWNSSDTSPVLTILGHDQAVYRCSFSPDGTRIISCSEDKTIRIWSFPEGYNIFVYRAHNAPVVSLRYSGTGRYIVSGSDYGERKILLWDATLPHFSDPVYFPHIIHWSPGGLIKKILVKQGVAQPTFWLSNAQLSLIKNDENLDIWDGDISDGDAEIPDSDGEGEKEEEEEEEKIAKIVPLKDDPFYKDDVKEHMGVSVMASVINANAERVTATEYNPGGMVYIRVQSLDIQITDAFITTSIIDTRLDIFSPKSGLKAGEFSLDAPIPWLPTLVAIDKIGRPMPYRPKPDDLNFSKDNHSVVFRSLETDKNVQEEKKSIETTETGEVVAAPAVGFVSEFEVVWKCPGAGFGGIVILVNYKVRGTGEWFELKYSLKESPIRINANGTFTNAEELIAKKFSFDQEERHRMFWQYVRDKDWKSAASFIDKKAVGYFFDEPVLKRFRIMNYLLDVFEDCSWLVLYTPFKYKAGVTKSVVIADSSIGEESDYSEEDADSFQAALLADDRAGEDNASVGKEEKPKVKEADPALDEQSLESSANQSLEEVYVASKNRRKTKNQDLPVAIFVDLFEGKEFEQAVANTASLEVSRRMYAESYNMEIAKELGVSNLNQKLIYLLQTEIQNEASMPDIYYDNIVDEIGSIPYPREEDGESGNLFGEKKLRFIEALNIESSMVKSGKFGPEVDDFTMLLPTYYPTKAGQAKYALHAPLARYEDRLAKVHIESLPTKLDQVYEPTIQDRMEKYYHKINKTEEKKYEEALYNLLQQEAKFRMIESNTYIATRRKTYFKLPGLNKHYPNPHYVVPAVIPRHIDFQRLEETKMSVFDKLFGKQVIKSTTVPPAGRKPPANEMYEIQVALFKSKSEKSKLKASSEVDNVQSAEEKEKVKQKLRLKMKKSKKKKSKVKMYRVETDGYPPDFFPGRRSYFPVAPGLEDFIDEPGKVPKNAKKVKVYSSKKITAMDADALMRPSDHNDHIDMHDDDSSHSQAVGLIRRFTVNGFELAHHGAVNDAVFSPSETRLATAGGDGLVKIWDPRDGTFVRSMKGHDAGVFSVQYTSSEQFLVSAGSDKQIIIWSLLTQSIQRKLKGHVDVIYRLAISPDCSLIVSASHDQTLKSWCTTPDRPDIPEPPRVIKVTDTTALIAWHAPPCFNCDVTAFHVQKRVGLREDWTPSDGKSLPPHFRNYIVPELIPATPYQFRICAENRMGRSEWSQPSVLIRTEFGLPGSPETPIICRITTTSLWIMWFAANPKTYGSASMNFEIQCNGDGKSYEENPTHTSTLEEVTNNGKKVLHYFTKMHERYEATKDALIKSKGFSMLRRQNDEELQEFKLSHTLSSEVAFDYLERTNSVTHLLVAFEYPNLHPGFMYSIRVRGGNVAGMGAWSEPTLSTSTLPTEPHPPNPPRLASSTLRSLTFQWDPPHDEGGSAITGYRIYLKNIDKYIDLPRSTTTFKWESLFPGRSYFMKVLAINEVGASDYSEFNSEEDSFTQTGVPEQPDNPIAVEGSWNSIHYEVNIPYHNGSTITAMQIEKRTVSPFDIGMWEAVVVNSRKSMVNNMSNLNFSVVSNSRDVTVVNYVDILKQQEEMEEKVLELEALKAKLGFSKDKKSADKFEKDIEELINSQKPPGSRIKFKVDELLPDLMYEIRVRFINGAGKSEFSQPSHRAKTNKASLPETCAAPTVDKIGENYVVLAITIPPEGGAPVKHFHLDGMSLDDNSTVSVKVTRSDSDVSGDVALYRLGGLKPGDSYVFRVKAESAVGFGSFSTWTRETQIPAPDDGRKSGASSVTAKK